MPLSAINDANDYAGPGTGYRPTGERWEEMKRLRHVTTAENPEDEVELTMIAPTDVERTLTLRRGRARPSRGNRPDEVVIAMSPAFGGFFSKTIVDVPHAEVIRQLLAGIEEQGVARAGHPGLRHRGPRGRSRTPGPSCPARGSRSACCPAAPR